MVELARRAAATLDTAWLKTLPPVSRYVFHGDPTAQAAAQAAWGIGFSADPCRAIVGDSRATLWLGPDEYLLLDATGDLEASSRQALAGLPHALVDISHRQFAMEVRGPYAATILSGACPLDLDLGEFPIGMCTRTVFAKADIVLWRTAADTFHLEVWRSFSGYVIGLLQEIAAEFPC